MSWRPVRGVSWPGDKKNSRLALLLTGGSHVRFTPSWRALATTPSGIAGEAESVHGLAHRGIPMSQPHPPPNQPPQGGFGAPQEPSYGYPQQPPVPPPAPPVPPPQPPQ